MDSGGEIYNDNTAAEFHTTILSIAESPVERGVIWVGTDDGNVQISRDDGASWTNVRDRVSGLPAETWIGNIEASPTEAGTAFLAVDNHRLDDFTPHVYETQDYGRTWRDLSAGLPQDDYAKVIRQHPDNPNLLFVGMERGLYASWDRGRTWVDLRFNLPRVSVRGIKIQRQYNDLVIGTHGRGAWILDDIHPLVELAEAIADDVYVFTVRTTTDWERWGRGSNLGQSTFTGDNPEPGAWIHYYLSDGAAEQVRGDRMAGDDNGASGTNGSSQEEQNGTGVSVRITDSGGNLVREFEDRDAGPGVNRAIWNLTWAGADPIPGTQQGGGFFNFGPQGPPASPGMYTATVIAAGREVSTQFRLRGDPNVAASQADYDARFTAAMRARDLENQLNQMVGTIMDLDGQVKGLVESIDGKGLQNESQIRSLASETDEKLTTLQGELRRPEGSMNYRDWPRLIEQLRFVVRGMNGAQARPTEGQLQVLSEVETAAAARAAELSGIVDGVIAELNRLLEGAPKILTDWQRSVS
jgi:hypothetical protein